MRDSEQKIEWLFINLRWFLLVAVASVIGLDVALRDSSFPTSALTLILVGSVANLIALIMHLQNASNPAMQNLMLAQDILISVGFILTSQDLRNQLLFISLVPITAAALRVSWASSTLVTFIVVLIYWAIAWFDLGLSFSAGFLEAVTQMLLPMINGAVLIIAGLAISQIGTRIKQAMIAEREERERRSHQALQMAHRRASLIFDLAGTLSATLNYERVLETALDISHAGLMEFFDGSHEISQVGMILLFGIDESLYVAKAHGASVSEEQMRFSAKHGILGRAIQSAEPVVTGDPSTDPELSRIHKMNECQQAIAVPLRAGYDSYGLLVLGSSEPDLYTNDFQDLLTAICNQAVLALQNARLYENLMDEKDRLVNVEEDARKKLARNLHDGPTQTIAAIAMRLNYIRLLVDQSPAEARQEIEQLESLARRTTKEIRQMLFTLRPLILESQGLVAALEQLRQKFQETSTVKLHLEADRVVDRLLTKDTKGSVFYIVEEATNNARKHAEANNIWIRLFQRGMHVVAEVEDDGKGFDVVTMEANYANRSSLGIINLRERATLVKGKTVINSAPGKGTKVVVTVPVNVPEPEGETQTAEQPEA